MSVWAEVVCVCVMHLSYLSAFEIIFTNLIPLSPVKLGRNMQEPLSVRQKGCNTDPSACVCLNFES